MPTCEVAVTGIGLVTPLGSTAVETAQAWRAGASAEFLPDPLLAGTPLEDMRVARRPVFDAAERLGGRRMLKFMSEAAVLGCVAAREACQQARLRERFRADRIGLFAGTGLAAANIEEARPMLEASIGADGHFSCAALGAKGLATANPLLSFKILANMPPCLISIIEGIKGPNLIFSPWDAQSAEVLIEAWRAVADGDVDAALAGAADHPAHPATVVYLRQSGRLKADQHPAPAGAYVVLESAEGAARNGQTALATVASIEVDEEPEAARCLVAGGPERAKRVEGRGARNPISDRLGRSFAAEPAVLLALASMTTEWFNEEGARSVRSPLWGEGGANAPDEGTPANLRPQCVAPSPRIRSAHLGPLPTGARVVSAPLHDGRSLRIRLRAPE